MKFVSWITYIFIECQVSNKLITVRNRNKWHKLPNLEWDLEFYCTPFAHNKPNKKINILSKVYEHGIY